MADTANLIVALKLQDGLSSGLGRVSGQLNNLSGSLGQVGRGIGQVAGGFDRILTRGAIAAGAALAGVVTTAISFEDAFAGVRKTVDATDAELADLRETFKEMSREIPLSFEEFAQIGETAGALGIASADIEEFTRVVALLGVTTDVTSDQAAVSLGQLSNVLGLTADDLDNFGAALVDLGNKGASTESQILELAARAGAGANLVGIAADQTLGWSSAVANLGIEVEAGGTALQKFFLESLRNLQDDDTLAIMAETAGTTGAAFKTAFETDASGALQTFLVGLGKLSQAEQLAVLDALGFSDQRITRTLLGLAGDADNLADSLTIAGKAWQENTALTTEAQKRFETTQSQLVLLKNNVRSAADTIGSELLPIINDLATEFVDFLNKPGTQTAIKDFAKDLAAGIRDLVAQVRGADFSLLIEGMKGAADVARQAFELFNKLPPDIKALAIGAVAVNKVSGGAVGGIARGLVNILGGIGGGLLGRGSSPANAVWVQSATGLAGAAGAGGGSSILKFLGLASAAGLGAIIGSEIGHAVFFDPTVKPAVEFETTQFERLLQSNDPEALRHGISAIESGLLDIGAWGPLAWVLAGDQIAILESQKATLELALAELRTANVERGLPPGGVGPFGRLEGKRGTSLPAKVLLPDTAMTALGTTSEQVTLLPPILTDAERAAQESKVSSRLTADRLSLTNSLLGQQLGRLAGILAKPTSVTVNTSTTVNIDGRKVSGTITKNQVLSNPGVF